MKKVRGKLYLHKSAIDDLTQEQKSIIEKAITCLQNDFNWNIIRLDSEDQVNFLYYPDFEEDPHPTLQRSFSVKITSGETHFRDYFKNNPPILHRKETFLKIDDENYEKFSKLTKQEEESGLLNPKISHKIGFKKYWEELLDKKGLTIINHQLKLKTQ